MVMRCFGCGRRKKDETVVVVKLRSGPVYVCELCVNAPRRKRRRKRLRLVSVNVEVKRPDE